MECKWAKNNKLEACFPASYQKIKTNGTIYLIKGLSLTSGFKISTIRSVLKFFSTTLGYGLMLLTMTFNYGMFFAVIFGFAVGTFLFAGHARLAGIEANINEMELKSSCCC